jgi:hypothetical protein
LQKTRILLAILGFVIAIFSFVIAIFVIFWIFQDFLVFAPAGD